MAKLEIARRYSKALFNLDLEKDCLDNRIKDFAFIVELLRTNQSFAAVLNSPEITLQQKREFLNSCFKTEQDSYFADFLFLLIKKRRLAYLESIAGEYRKLVNRHCGVWEVEMAVAAPVQNELVSHVVDILESSSQKKVKVHTKIRPDIVGGAILTVDNISIDGSVTGRLRNMKEHLLEREK